MSRLLAALVAVAVAAGAVVLFLGDDGSGHPDDWDERVAHLVEFVEDERGHDFEHPVAVDFLDDEAYAEVARVDAGELTDDELEEIERAEALLRALGLVSGDVDLFESVNDLSDTGTLARYDIEEQRIIVRGTEVTPDLEVTLVHELTHALQDQVFGLAGLADPDGDATSGELFAFRALAEGDAGRIERAYVASLDDEAQAAVREATREGLDGLESEGVPVALQALFGAPYALGDPFVAFLDADGDVDDAFESPPTTEEHLLDPFSYAAGDEPVEVEPPDVGDAEVVDEGDFGAASLFLVLSERIDVATAYDAVIGWGGDAYVAYKDDGVLCVQIAVTGDDAGETDELEAALSEWVSAVPASAGVERDGDVVRFRSCDPGDDATEGSGAGLDALLRVSTRNAVVAQTLASGAEEEQATCFADAIVEELSPEELSATELTPELQQRINDAALACR